MKCEEVAEFVSAVCDCELIPPDAASHIGGCESCRALLNQYVQIGAELRRLASIEITETVRSGVWEEKRNRWGFSTIWHRAFETMRLPKVAFAALVLIAVALGSGLVMTKVRAQAAGSVLMLTIKPDGEDEGRCALSMRDANFNRCATVQMVRSGFIEYEVQVLGAKSGRVQLGVRSKFVTDPGPFTLSPSEFADQSQEKYWFEPNKAIQIAVQGHGFLSITGQFMDHMPTLLSTMENNELDPRSNQLRIFSPLLLRDNRTVFDFPGMLIQADHNSRAVQMYQPHLGRYIYSLSPLKGAVQGHVDVSRISYELEGCKYELLTGAPIARAAHIWVLHQPHYKPSQDSLGSDGWPFGGALDPKSFSELAVHQ